MSFLIMYFPLLSLYFMPLGSKNYPQRPVLKHPQFGFLRVHTPVLLRSYYINEQFCEEYISHSFPRDSHHSVQYRTAHVGGVYSTLLPFRFASNAHANTCQLRKKESNSLTVLSSAS
jgi:hypothetical protein